MRSILAVAVLLCGGCASTYRSVDAVDAAPPQLVESVSVPFEQAYSRVVAGMTRCYFQYRLQPSKQDGRGRVYVVADNIVAGGTDVWLAVTLDATGSGTRVSTRWGSPEWEAGAKLAAGWAQTDSPSCST